MVNVQRYILGSFFLLNFGGRQQQAEQNKQTKTQSPIEQDVKLPES